MNDQNSREGETVSLHRKIASHLGQQVSAGKLKPGERLPSERQIARHFDASRATVRTALQHLEQEGLISRRERRSAVVAMRRNVAPHLRIACSRPGLVNLFSQLGQVQILPPRCQIQLLDLQQPGTAAQLTGHPVTGADVLICELEYVKCFSKLREYRCELPERLLTEAHVPAALRNMCRDDQGNCLAAPLGVSPVILYVNGGRLGPEGKAPSKTAAGAELFDWAKQLTRPGQYGLQFRPTFSHVSALLASQGAELYDRSGKFAAQANGRFEPAVRAIHDMLHVHKTTPLLPRTDQINLFADKRCAMAIDGFEMFGLYSRKFQQDLRLHAIKYASTCGACEGLALIPLGGTESAQPVEDLVRMLLSAETQKHLVKNSVGLPVRSDLLNVQALAGMGVPGEVGSFLIEQLELCRGENLPTSLQHKQAVNNLFLELWLGLDNIDNICRRFKEL